jgi:hypothetical protein
MTQNNMNSYGLNGMNMQGNVNMQNNTSMQGSTSSGSNMNSGSQSGMGMMDDKMEPMDNIMGMGMGM